jgi:hypothetical protein
MSDSDPTTTAVRTAPVRWPAGRKKPVPPPADPPPAEERPGGGSAGGSAGGSSPDRSQQAAAPPEDPAAATPAAATPAAAHTGPVPVRPAPRHPHSGPLTRMGPWAPVAGGLVGIALGVVAVVLLAGQAGDFRDRLSLVFLVAGLGLLGAAGTLLADEVRMVRWRAREAALRPAAWADTTATLLGGLTPARLLLLAGGFVLFLAAWVPSP